MMRETDEGGVFPFFFTQPSTSTTSFFFCPPPLQSDPFAWGLCVAAPAAALFSNARAGNSNGLAAFAAASGNPFLSAAQCSAAATEASSSQNGACFSSLSSASAAAGGANKASAAAAVPVAKAGDESSPNDDGNDGDGEEGNRFRFSAGAAMLPHPEKVAKGGEDAFFLSDDGLTLGEDAKFWRGGERKRERKGKKRRKKN